MEHTFRIFDFNVYNDKSSSSDASSSDDEQNVYKDSSTFMIQIFAVNEKGKTCSIIVDGLNHSFTSW